MRSHARLLATVASLALVTHRAVQARNGGHQCGLSVLQSHLADVQGECCFSEGRQVAQRIGPNLRAYWNFEDGDGSEVARDLSDNGNDGTVQGASWERSSLAGASPPRLVQEASPTKMLLRRTQGARVACTCAAKRSCAGHRPLRRGCRATEPVR